MFICSAEGFEPARGQFACNPDGRDRYPLGAQTLHLLVAPGMAPDRAAVRDDPPPGDLPARCDFECCERLS